MLHWRFPGSSASKEFACNAGDPGLSPGLGRSPGEGIGYPLQYSWASLVAQLVKNLPAIWETWVQSLGWEDPLENGTATHSSILAWRIPWTVYSMRSQRVRHDWTTFTFFHAAGLALPASVALLARHESEGGLPALERGWRPSLDGTAALPHPCFLGETLLPFQSTAHCHSITRTPLLCSSVNKMWNLVMVSFYPVPGTGLASGLWFTMWSGESWQHLSSLHHPAFCYHHCHCTSIW